MQLNVRTNPACTRELDALVRHTGLKTLTADITRTAHESYDFRQAAGIARKLKTKARFQNDDELYSDGMP